MNFVIICMALTTVVSVIATNQLSFSGGGAFGAVELGILKRIYEVKPNKYDRYTGISAGGLNAGFLSHYENLHEGIVAAEQLYSNIRNRDIYEIHPETGNSLLNTYPLSKTLTNVITNMASPPIINTLIGAVNLHTGNLDTYTYDHHLSTDDKVRLLMSTSAIPIVFPPINFNHSVYADGGTLSNELLDIVHSSNYLNITYISPYGPMDENDADISTLKEMVIRTFQIVKRNFNNPFSRLNRDCDTPYGEITYYYVEKQSLQKYSMLNFDNGDDLISIGYHNVISRKYKLC